MFPKLTHPRRHDFVVDNKRFFSDWYNAGETTRYSRSETNGLLDAGGLSGSMLARDVVPVVGEREILRRWAVHSHCGVCVGHHEYPTKYSMLSSSKSDGIVPSGGMEASSALVNFCSISG